MPKRSETAQETETLPKRAKTSDKVAAHVEKPRPSSSGQADEEGWTKSLKVFPMFMKRQIENHKDKSGKIKISSKKAGKPIQKTLKKGLKFKEERYLNADSVYVKIVEKEFLVKAKCRASMSKREVHNLKTALDVQTGEVVNAHCTCKAGNSAYCNHIMALLFELADYSLHELDEVPEEAACTSRARAWGIPGERTSLKNP